MCVGVFFGLLGFFFFGGGGGEEYTHVVASRDAL